MNGIDLNVLNPVVEWSVDAAGFVWTFLDETRDQARVAVGVIVVTSDEVDPVPVLVVALTKRPTGTKVHLALLPGDPASTLRPAGAHLLPVWEGEKY